MAKKRANSKNLGAAPSASSRRAKDVVISFRCDPEFAARIERYAIYLKGTIPAVNWTKSTAAMHAISLQIKETEARGEFK